jgi:hypothetical protein
MTLIVIRTVTCETLRWAGQVGRIGEQGMHTKLWLGNFCENFHLEDRGDRMGKTDLTQTDCEDGRCTIPSCGILELGALNLRVLLPQS